MRRRSVPAAALGILVTLALPSAALASGGPSAAATRCTTSLPPGVYGDLVVPPGQSCTLTDSSVGTVAVQNGGTLDLAPSTRAVVRGNLNLGPSSVFYQEDGWTVDGTTMADQADWVLITGGTSHDIVSRASQDFYIYDDPTVDGNVDAERTQGYVEIASSRPITGNLVASGEPGTSGGLFIEGQQIGGSLYDTDNQSQNTIYSNAIGGDLVCEGNNPPPTDYGYGNYVRGREIGQCAGFPNSPADGPLGG